MSDVKEQAKRTLGQILHDNRVRKINRLYAIYRLDPSENNMNDLLKEVIKLATRKMRDIAVEVGEVDSENEDDFAQKASITVWEKLAAGEEINNFYSWVITIILNHKKHLSRDLKNADKAHVPMMLSDEYGNEYDNPEVYKETGVVYGSATIIPEGLDEDDELICYMILEKKSYAEIARFLDVGVRTVERRVAGLKERYGKEAQIA